MSSFDFLKRFWAYALSLLALVAGYFGLQQADYGWLILPIAGTAALLALARPALEAVSRLRRYPRLLTDIATLQRERDDARASVSELSAQSESRWSAGVQEGRAQVLGAQLAAALDAVPELAAVGMTNDGLLLTAKTAGHDAVQLGARFDVLVTATGDPRGVVEVTAVEGGLVHMECVSRDAAAFWDALERRADENPLPPPGITLAVPVLEHPFREVPIETRAARLDLGASDTADVGPALQPTEQEQG